MEDRKEVYSDIINSIDIVETIKKYVALEKSENTYFEGVCPFNSQCGKSFVIDPTRKSWYCFGCQAKGDIVTFISKIGNMNRSTAGRFLTNLEKSRNWSNNGSEEGQKKYSECSENETKE